MQTILVTGGTGLVGQGIRLALERTKNSIHNILNGKDFNYMDD